jgi:hypothetical protein
MQEYGQANLLRYLLPCWQMQMCLMGEDVTNPSILCGSAIDAKEACSRFKITKDPIGLRMATVYQLQLAVYFGDWEYAECLLPDMKRTYTKVQVHFVGCIGVFFTALSHYSVFKHTRKRAHRRDARKSTDIIRKWVKACNVNCQPMLALLDAEKVALSSGGVIEISNAYQQAIEVAAQHGFAQEYEAIASERAGSALLDIGDRQKAKPFLVRSRDLFGAWGALAKVEDMESKHQCLRR